MMCAVGRSDVYFPSLPDDCDCDLSANQDTVGIAEILKERNARKIHARANARMAKHGLHLKRSMIIICCWSLTVVFAIHGSGTICIGESSFRSLEKVKSRLRSLILRRHETTDSFGFYYGIPRMLFESCGSGLSTDIDSLPRDNDDYEGEDDASLAKRRYYDSYENIGRDVEKWAAKMLNEGIDNIDDGMFGIQDQDGWTEVFCAKALRNKFNMGNNSSVPITRQWVKWMKDSRGRHADSSDSQKHPCMKLSATIDAPFPIVCRYLSEKNRFREYNSLLIDQEDVEVLTPHSKICWSQSKKLLFIQPRDFVTYCRHRWLKDGTQLITNQACEHPSTTLNDDGTDTDGDTTIAGMSGFRAFSLRGASYISRCPDFPNERTKLVLLSHCNCGRDVPEWAVRAAVGVLAPIKPFEIIHRIDVGIRRAREELERAEKQHTTTCATTGRSSRPAGMAQMGYACFWPEGGGIVDEPVQ